MTSFPFGMNRVVGNAATPSTPNPFSMQSPVGFGHGSAEHGGSTSRARSRERGRSFGAAAMPDGGPTPKTPRTERPRTPRVERPTVQEEVNQEDMAGRITALENMAVTHATFLQQVHDDVANMKKSGSQITAKIVSLDKYSQNIDKRVTAIRDEAEHFYRQTGQSVMGRVEQLERQLQLLIRQTTTTAAAAATATGAGFPTARIPGATELQHWFAPRSCCPTTTQ